MDSSNSGASGESKSQVKDIHVVPNPKRTRTRLQNTFSSAGGRLSNGPRKFIQRDIDPKTHIFNFSVAAILETIGHETFTKYDFNFTNLARFDDPTTCGLSKGEAQRLSEIEVKRLIKDATSATPVLFDSQGVLDLATRDNFKAMSNLADQILCNLAIINLENQILIFEHCPTSEMINIAAVLYTSTRATLIKRYHHSDKVKRSKPKTLEPSSRNEVAYFLLIDFITSSIARLLVRSASSEAWNSQILAVLAQWSVKLKALSSDPTRFAEAALSNGEEVVLELNEQSHRESRNVLQMREVETGDSQGKEKIDLPDDPNPNILYYGNNCILRHHMSSIFRDAIMCLYSPSFPQKQTETFQTCTLVYESGLDRSLIVIEADREGNVATSSVTMHVKAAYSAMKLVVENIEELKKRESPSRNAHCAIEPAVLRWHWSEDRSAALQERTLITTKFDDLVSVLVPQALARPYVAEQIQQTIATVTNSSEEEDHIPRFKHRHFQAKCILSTGEFENKQRKMREESQKIYHDPTVVPLSDSPLSARIRAGTTLNHLSEETSSDPKGALSPSRQVSDKVLSQYQKDARKMASWVFDETSVTVKCRTYVKLVLSLCVIIVLGGLAIPFSLQGETQKIFGFDPFQITTFVWLLVGVVLIFAKSRYVSEWPWHDFMHGRVVCHSISDLADVTGVDAQMVLTKLLHNERKSILVTRGPFNGMFSRKAEQQSNGFSIDVAVQLSTMLASGFIILKVLSHSGEHLISLDARKGSQLDYASKTDSEVNYLSCIDLEDLEHEDEDTDLIKTKFKGPNKVLYLTRNELKWNRLLGLYLWDSHFG